VVLKLVSHAQLDIVKPLSHIYFSRCFEKAVVVRLHGVTKLTVTLVLANISFTIVLKCNFITDQSPKIVPCFRAVSIETNASRQGVERVLELVCHIVKFTNGYPVFRTARTMVGSQLVIFEGLHKMVRPKVRPAKEVPGLAVARVWPTKELLAIPGSVHT
jgi:hypothetical protein